MPVFWCPTREEFYDDINNILNSREFIRNEAKKDGIPEYSAIAKQIYDSRKIKKVQIEGAPIHYDVEDPNGMICNVSIINKNCSCGQKNICPHMLAVLVYAGVSSHFGLPPGVKVYPPGRDVKGQTPQHGRKHTQKKDEKVRRRKKKMKIPNPFARKKTPRKLKFPDSEDDTTADSNYSVHSEVETDDNIIELFSDDDYPQSQHCSPNLPSHHASPLHPNSPSHHSSPLYPNLPSHHSSPLYPNLPTTHPTPNTTSTKSTPTKPTIPPTPKISPITHLDYDPDLPEHLVRIYPMGRKIYHTNEGHDIAVLCVDAKTPYAVVLAREKEHLPTGILNLAVRSILTQLPAMEKMKRNYNTARVGVALVKKTSVEDAARPGAKYPIPKFSTLHLQCFCFQHIERSDTYVECVLCKVLFHEHCSGAEKEDKNYMCPTCTLISNDFHGAAWGAPIPHCIPRQLTLQNTCSIDNYLTLFGLVIWEQRTDRDFAQLFEGDTQFDKVFTQCVQLAGLGTEAHFSQAQQKWANQLGKDDLQGSQEEMITEKITNANRFSRVMQCTQPRCPTIRQDVDIFYFSNHVKDPQEALEQILKPAIQKTCPYCQTGVSIPTGLECFDPDQPSPYIEISNVGRKFTYDECMHMDDTITIGACRYEKKMITILIEADKSDKTAVGHFTAAIKSNDQWLYYNGFDPKGERFLPIHPRHYGRKEHAINNVLYVYVDGFGNMN